VTIPAPVYSLPAGDRGRAIRSGAPPGIALCGNADSTSTRRRPRLEPASSPEASGGIYTWTRSQSPRVTLRLFSHARTRNAVSVQHSGHERSSDNRPLTVIASRAVEASCARRPLPGSAGRVHARYVLEVRGKVVDRAAGVRYLILEVTDA
jgi:hypothetical protein